MTNSKVRFVMVVDSSNTALRDNEIRSVSVGGAGTGPGLVGSLAPQGSLTHSGWVLFQMFRKLHNSYTDVMCNPFYNPGDRIQSRWARPGSTQPFGWVDRGFAFSLRRPSLGHCGKDRAGPACSMCAQ